MGKPNKRSALVNARCFIALTCFILVGGCAGSNTATTAQTGDTEFVFAQEYRIGVADNLTVNVYGHDDVSSSVVVRPDGKITIPIAGDIAVGGKVPENVAAEIKQILSKYIRDPIVTVTVANTSGLDYLSRIRVTGAVVTPQSMEFKNGMTVLDVVLEAGGPNEFASPRRTKVYRSGVPPLLVRLDLILSGKDLSSNLNLKPGDVVSVPERVF